MNKDLPARATALSSVARDDVMIERRDVSDELIDLAALVGVLWRRRMMIIGGSFACALLTALIVVSVPSVYTASARLMLDPRSREPIDIENVVGRVVFGAPVILSEIALIATRDNLERVARDLDLPALPEFNPELEERSLLSSAVSASMSAVRRLFRGSGSGGPPAGSGGPPVDPIGARIATAAAILGDKVVVSQLGESLIINISVTTEDPALSAAIANTLARAHIDRQVGDKVETAEQATSWLASRVAELGGRVQEADLAVARFRALNFSETSVSPEALATQIDQVGSRIGQLRLDLADAQARRVRFAALVSGRQMTAAAQIATTDALNGLLQRRSALLQQGGASETASLAVRAALSSVDAAIADELAELAVSLEVVEGIAADRLRANEAEFDRLETARASISSRIIELESLEREAETQRQVYQTFLTRLTETRERSGFQEADARVVVSAVPPKLPAGPQRALLTLLAGLMGGGLAAGAALLLDVRRDTMRTPQDFEKAAMAPLAGALPITAELTAKSRELRARLAKLAPEVEQAMRRIRASLIESGRPTSSIVVLTASAAPGEDSSRLAALLATVAAGEGRVALAHCDAFDAPPLGFGEGSVEHLADLGFDLCRVDRELATPSASRAEIIRASVAALRERYDYIVLDAAPVLAAPDTLIFARESDFVLLAARWDDTPRSALAAAATQLRRSGARPTAIVATRVEASALADFVSGGARSVANAVRRYHRRR